MAETITVRMAGQLRKLTKGRAEIQLVANDIDECINHLEKQFPGTRDRLCDENGELLDEINIYLDGDNIRSLQGLATRLKVGVGVDVMSAFAAG